LPQVLVGGGGRLVGSKDLGALLGAPLRRLRPGNRADHQIHHARRTGEGGGVAAGELRHGKLHKLRPDGRRTGEAGGVLHGGVIGIAHPHTGHQVGGVANGPVIAVVVGGAGLGGRGKRQIEHGIGAEHRRAGGIVREDRTDQVGVFGAQRLHGLGRLIFVNHVAFVIHNPSDGYRRHLLPAVGKDGIGAGHLQQAHITAAQRQRQAIIIAGERGDAQPLGKRHQSIGPLSGGVVINANVFQRLDRRDVK